MRCAAKLAIKVIGPGVVGTGDLATELLWLVNQDHAAMPADVLEHVDPAVCVAHHQQRHAEEFDGLDHAGARDILAESYRGPTVLEKGFPLKVKHVLADITGVWQAIGTFDGRHDVAQIDHDGYPLQVCF